MSTDASDTKPVYRCAPLVLRGHSAEGPVMLGPTMRLVFVEQPESLRGWYYQAAWPSEGNTDE